MHEKQRKRRQDILAHINRIQGQIEALKKTIHEGDCLEVASLTTAIAKSFDTLRFRTLEGFLINHVLGGKESSAEKLSQIQGLLKLYKK